MTSISASKLKLPVQPPFKAPEMPQSIKDLADKKPGTPGNPPQMPIALKQGTKPTAVQEKAVDTAGAKAVSDYKTAIADSKKRTQLAEAITGKDAKDVSKDQKTKVDNYLKEVAKKDAAPDFDAAATGSAKDVAKGNKKLGGEILKQGVDGAYVAENKTALISNDLVGKNGKETAQLKAAVREETGEWLAAGAAKAGVKVGAGDAGNRLALALDGKMEKVKDPSLNKDSTADKTTVRIGGKTYEAEAKAVQPTKGIWITGIDKSWSLKLAVKGKVTEVKNNSAGDWHKSDDYIGTAIPLNYSGTVTLQSGGKKVDLYVRNYGRDNQKITSDPKSEYVSGMVNNETVRITSKKDVDLEATALKSRTVSLLTHLDDVYSQMDYTVPAGASSDQIVNDYITKMNKTVETYGNANTGFSRRMSDFVSSLSRYREMGVSQKDIAKLIDAAAGSTGINGTSDFATQIKHRFDNINTRMDSITQGFTSNLNDQKKLDKAKANAAGLQSFLSSLGNLIATGGAAAAIGMLVKASKLTTPVAISLSGAAVGNFAVFGVNNSYTLRRVTDLARKSNGDYTKITEGIKKLLPNDQKQLYNNLSSGASNFVGKFLSGYETAVLKGSPSFTATLSSRDYNQGGGQGQMTHDGILALAKAKLGLRNEDYLKINWSQVKYGNTPYTKLDVWYRP